MNIVIIQRIFSNYRKPIFDRLVRKYDLLLLHGKNKNGIKQIHTDYSKEINQIKYYKKETNIYLPVFHELFRLKPKVVIHEFNPSIVSLYPLFFLRKLWGFKLILWGHGFNKNNKNQKSLSAKVRIILAKQADVILFYSHGGKEKMLPFVKTPEKLFVANNTLDTDKLIELRKEFEKKDVSAIKMQLNISHQYNIVFIGRLLEEKILPDIFVSIITRLNKMREDVAVHFIGDGEVKDVLMEKLSVFNNVFFHGALYDDEETGKFLYISDLLLNPGYLGLSVNHALAFGTPVFSFKEGVNGPFHSPEAEYIVHDKNGYFAQAYDADELVTAINNYLNNDGQQKVFYNNAIKTIETTASIQNMENRFINAINYCLKNG